MSPEEYDGALKLVTFARDIYDLRPTRITTRRMANKMNIADARLGIVRPRKWAIHDFYVLVLLPSGPRVVMYNP